MTDRQEPLILAPEDSAFNAIINGVNGQSNGTSENPSITTPRGMKLDPNVTQNVLNATGPKASPRAKQVVHSLIQHIHDFSRENELTMGELMAGVEMINQAGRMSDERRDEGQLMCEIIGLESLVDSITYQFASSAPNAPTSATILGPFWRADPPHRQMGESIVHSIPDGDHTFMHGRVTDYLTGEPIEGAELDVWHGAPNGLYEQQDENQVDFNLRGRFTTGKDGNRHPMRPAHIHFIVSAPGHKPIATQIFDRRDPHLAEDAVFAVKDSLVVDFLPREGDPKADFELPYDFKLATFEEAKKHGVVGTTEESAGGGC
ncbi:MAG: aromatic compound dioxygenase [Lasallia pustulata]|uniref:Aromatic compound dioxygenase n=1 Tax=Lasallia pustulata TaxID=136370 RepID=A0A5M8PG20_9LECA|nr:MAG: aromatic compound dioxygenase [Lasallia pustulata]